MKMIAFGLSVTMLISMNSGDAEGDRYQYSMRCTEEEPCSDHVTPQEISNRDIMCNGYGVCSYSPKLEVAEFLHCHGLESCMYSDIIAPWLSINGQYAVEGSDISSNSDSLTMLIGGFRAGLGTTITCPTDGECVVRCFEESSCYYTTVFYHKIDDVTLEPAACIDSTNFDVTHDHVFCPKLVRVTWPGSIDDIKEAEKEEMLQSEQYQVMIKEMHQNGAVKEAFVSSDHSSLIMANTMKRITIESFLFFILGGLIAFIATSCYYQQKYVEYQKI